MARQQRVLPSAFSKSQTSNARENENKVQTTLLFDTELDDPTPVQPRTNIQGKKYVMGGVEVHFPFQAYQAQIQVMSKIITALQKSENALLESPTGSGKSLAILCSALAWKEHQKKKHIQSVQEMKENEKRVWEDMMQANDKQQTQQTQQTEQTEQLQPSSIPMKREITDDDDFQPIKIRKRPTLLGTQPRKIEVEVDLEKSPPVEDSDRQNSEPASEVFAKIPRIYVGSRTQLMIEKGTCAQFHNKFKIIQHRSLRPDNTNAIWDIEDLVRLGKSVRDPKIRNSMDIDLTDNIVIFDEAHNIEDAARGAGSFEVADSQLNLLQIELRQVIRNGFLIEEHQSVDYLVNSILEYINDQDDNAFTKDDFDVRICTVHGTKFKEKLNELGVTETSFNTTLLPAYKAVRAHADRLASLKEESRLAAPENSENNGHTTKTRSAVTSAALAVLGGLFMILEFFFENGKDYAADYQIALMKRKHLLPNNSKDNWKYKIGFWCLNPGVIFRQLSDITHSIILTSGTLSPLNTFASELDAQFKIRLEANHVIDSSQVWVRTIPRGPSNLMFRGVYAEMEKFQYRDEVGNARSIPFGILCFVPSYSVMDKMIDRWKATGLYDKIDKQKYIFTEPKTAGKKAFDAILQTFYNRIQTIQDQGTMDGRDGALMLAVYRGRASEGIDFSDNYCRAVVALSIPFPHARNIQVNLKREYNNRKNRENPAYLSSDEWYCTQAYRAINQALGRCIRHRQDWGAIILLEERFSERRHVDGLSKWLRGLCVTHTGEFEAAMDSLRSFTEQRIGSQRKMVEASPLIEDKEDTLAAI
ncbi:Fanconi anemia group J protein [Apophysomyces ossiformis]|uniref:DNA 5'-3' helicase n=1 Tax=Apophysomyces ossiformis TaxID=679940 RepID=A0A8H7BM75_9FUNG|nr:Fanconi anemia group J protein [Apophysomyces ossiformis]